MSFCPGTERWDRTLGTEMSFCPRPRRFVPGQKGGTERLGQKGWDRTSRYHFESARKPAYYTPLFPANIWQCITSVCPSAIVHECAVLYS